MSANVPTFVQPKTTFKDRLVDLFYDFFVWPLGRLNRWVRDRVNPKQAWLTRQVPRYYMDQASLIPDLMFKCIIGYVDRDLGIIDAKEQIRFREQEWMEASTEKRPQIAARMVEAREFLKNLSLAYDWARLRESEQSKIGDGWEAPKTPEERADFLERIRVQENHIRDEDLRHLTWIVQNRERLWVSSGVGSNFPE